MVRIYEGGQPIDRGGNPCGQQDKEEDHWHEDVLSERYVGMLGSLLLWGDVAEGGIVARRLGLLLARGGINMGGGLGLDVNLDGDSDGVFRLVKGLIVAGNVGRKSDVVCTGEIELVPQLDYFDADEDVEK
jgi:hypothetical protein